MGPRARAAVVVSTVFAAGFLTGMVFERHDAVPATAAMSPAEEHDAAMDELQELLELDSEQVAQIHAILVDRQKLVETMWEQFRPEVQTAMRQVHVDIANLLRPDQRERFHEWLTRRRAEQDPSSSDPLER